MNTPLLQLPASFSPSNTFSYISKLLAKEQFDHNPHDQICVLDRKKIAQECIEKMRSLLHEHPQDAHYLGEYLYAFQHTPCFRNKTLEKIISGYKNTLRTLISQTTSA